jgi:hypothetical protein
MKEWATTIPTFLYTMKAKTNIHETAAEICKYYMENGVQLKEQVDFIVIHDQGIISNYKCPELNTISSATVEDRKGWIFEPCGKHTLARFIAYLNVFNYCQTKTSPFVLLPYITDSTVKDKLVKCGTADMFYNKYI